MIDFTIPEEQAPIVKGLIEVASAASRSWR